MAIKHIIFDWDGTLVDTIPLIKKAYDYTFEKIGNTKKLSYQEIKEIAGKYSNQNIFNLIFADKQVEAKKHFYDFIEQTHLIYLQPFQGAEEILKYCEKNNIKMHILTNKKRTYLDLEKKQLNWDKYFENIICADEKEHDKPYPDTCLSLFTILPPAEEMLVLGDGDADVAMANVFGAKSVIFDPKNTYKGQDPNYKIKSLDEFIDIIQAI